MTTQRLRRRDFLKSVPVGTAAAWAALTAGSDAAQGMGGMGGMGGGMGGSGTIIDPPVSGLFQDPAEMPVKIDSLTDPMHRILTVTLMAKQAPVSINNTPVNLMTYNGSFPGPTIRARKGDILKVNITNALPYTSQKNILGYQRNLTNLHAHGCHLSPQPPNDYVMYALNFGETYHHAYDTSLIEAGALNFYHPHKHGLVAEQFWSGLIGGLVIEDPDSTLAGFETHLMILKDISINGSQPAAYTTTDYMQGKEGSTVMVNGQVNPRLNIKMKQVQRWRILNASNARFYRLSLEGHNLNLIGTDGGLLDAPYPRSEIILSPGERIDVMVRADQKAGSYRLLALPYSRMGMMGSTSTITLMTMTYSGSLATPQGIPQIINPAAVRLDPSMLPIAATRTMTLSMSMGMGMGMGISQGFVNGQNFDVDPYSITSTVGSYEIWNVVNDSMMDHPFHQHVNHAQVLEVNGGDPGYASLYTTTPALKDVVLVPMGGSVKLLVPVKDYDGMAMFHCHILEHEDIGMMGIWNMANGSMPPMSM